MTKHVHAEMIKAKADNMDLVVFTKSTIANKWEVTDFNDLVKNPDFEFFLCLPQHKETCLHWLNGGEVQIINDTYHDWEDCGTYAEYPEWYAEKWMMSSKNKYRIKPRKEKRHIYISTLGATTYAKKTKEEAAREVNIMGGSFGVWKHYEIEIEVEI